MASRFCVVATVWHPSEARHIGEAARAATEALGGGIASAVSLAGWQRDWTRIEARFGADVAAAGAFADVIECRAAGASYAVTLAVERIGGGCVTFDVRERA